MRWRWKVLAAGVPVAAAAALAGTMWHASAQLLFPSWKGAAAGLGACGTELVADWGPACGNLKTSRELRITEVRIPSLGGYDLPGWLVGSAANGMGPAQGAILLVHGGGADRRAVTRFVRTFLRRRLDVLTFDLGCAGDAPCPVPGLSYGERESRDVESAYLFLAARYERVLAMGSSVGASSILIALPAMPRLEAVVAENPVASFERLILETPTARSIPAWMKRLLVRLAMLRGRFDGLSSAVHALQVARGTPILFIHSKRDGLVPFEQTEALAARYAGPKVVWLADRGDHASIWNVDPAEYERRLTAFLDDLPGPALHAAP